MKKIIIILSAILLSWTIGLAQSVTTVKVKNTLSLEINKSSSLNATIIPDSATNKNVSWDSDNVAVATVNAAGKVQAVGIGTANITVKTDDGGKKAICKVTVQSSVKEEPKQGEEVTKITLPDSTIYTYLIY